MESMDLGRFIQSRIGRELIPEDGLTPDFTLKMLRLTDDRELDKSIQTFYNIRGYQQPDSNELYFTKGHQRRTVCLAIEGTNAYVTICNPNA